MSQTQTRIAITPRCIIRTPNHAAVAPLQALFAHWQAARIGLRGVAQRYVLAHGNAQREGTPLLLLRDHVSGQTQAADRDALTARGDIPQDDISMLFSLAQAARPQAFLEQEMLDVTSRALWLVALPGVIVMQAENIVQEIEAARGLSANLRGSIWARAAYATLQIAPSTSAHEHIAMLGRLAEAQALMQAFRPEAAAQARSAGFDLAPVTPSDLAQVARA